MDAVVSNILRPLLARPHGRKVTSPETEMRTQSICQSLSGTLMFIICSYDFQIFAIWKLKDQRSKFKLQIAWIFWFCFNLRTTTFSSGQPIYAKSWIMSH